VVGFEFRAFALQVPPQQDQHADGHGDQQHGKDEAERVAAKHRRVFGVRGVGHSGSCGGYKSSVQDTVPLPVKTSRAYLAPGSSFSVTVSQSSTTPEIVL